MKNTKRSFLRMGGLILVLVFALTALVTIAGASATAVPDQAPRNAPQAAIDNPATCTVAVGSVACDLYATTGTLALPGGATVPIWGYSDTASGLAQLPGPTIIATEGDSVSITLYNNLGDDTALTFPGQAMIPDLTGVPNGGSKVYTFFASDPGTYLYEAGLLPDAARQVAMGMFGTLVVRPFSGANHAYDASSVFDEEALLVLSEIDPNLNANPAGFDMRDFWPQYRLINGVAYPDTAEIPTAAGNRVLLRYVNAGIQQHTMGVLGMDQSLIARDGSLRPYPQRELTESIGPGRTADAILTVPASAGSLGETHFALYDASLLLHNNGVGFGGMLTFITVTDGTPPATGPTTGSVTLAPNPTDNSVDVTLSATISGDVNITEAEYFVDATDGTGCSMTGVFGSTTVPVSALIPTSGAIAPCVDLALLSSGDHTFYVHGSDGTWARSNFAVLHVDKLGPATTGITLAPNPSNGGVSGSNTEQDLSGMTLTDSTAPFSGLDYLVGGTLSNTTDGSSCTIAALTATTLTCELQLSGGTDNTWELGEAYKAGVAVAVSATGNDSATGNSNIAAAEFFIDATGTDGSGTSLVASPVAPIASLDGTIDTLTMAGLLEGAHTVSIHSMDIFDQWGAFTEATLAVDKTGPDTSNVVADPNPNNGSQPYNPTVFAVRVDATISDPSSGTPGVNSTILRAEGFITNVTADGSGFPLTPARDGLFNESVEDAYVYIPLSTISTLGVGTHKIYVHGQDASGNWGATGFVDFVIETDIPSVTNVAVTPNTTDGTGLVDLTANAADPTSNIVRAEWFAGIDPGTGGGTAMDATDGFFDSLNEGLTAMINASGWAPGQYQLNVRAMDAAGNWSPTAFAILTVTAGPPTAPELLYFSTFGRGLVPGTSSPYDDADVYLWDGGLTAFSREFDARTGGANILATNADIDGLAFDANAGGALGLYYISFRRNQGTNVPGVGVVQDEDVVKYNPEDNEWQIYFAGVDVCDGMDASNGHDIDAYDIVGGISFSTAGNAAIAGVAGPYDDADIYSIDPVLGCIRVFDASTTGLDRLADIDGLTVVDGDTFYISFDLDAGTFVPGLGTVQDESVVLYDAGALTLWSLYFDGTAQGLGATDSQDLDAIDVQ